MSVDVDESGTQHMTMCIDFAGRSALEFSDRENLVAINCDVTLE